MCSLILVKCGCGVALTRNFGEVVSEVEVRFMKVKSVNKVLLVIILLQTLVMLIEALKNAILVIE